ncbi:unnamed protein product [Lupinus luteus]|uniref:Uncharacterized protein n=1 Tax=Lupinus luteus TaxID=3873 RepID=A0AAV1WXX6_LUPLU
MEQKFQILLRNVINQNNSGVVMEALATMLSTPGTSTSTHVPNNDKLYCCKLGTRNCGTTFPLLAHFNRACDANLYYIWVIVY